MARSTIAVGPDAEIKKINRRFATPVEARCLKRAKLAYPLFEGALSERQYKLTRMLIQQQSAARAAETLAADTSELNK
jgi:hypothetical protein